jgi:uncharacterized OB-fold protein
MTGTFTPRPEWLNLDREHATIEAGALCIQRCAACGRWQHPPRRYCAGCHSLATGFEPVAGTATVASFSVSHRSLDPGWQDRAPFVTLVLELDEGPRVLAATDLRLDEVAIGDRARIRIEQRSDDFTLLWAEPADA